MEIARDSGNGTIFCDHLWIDKRVNRMSLLDRLLGRVTIERLANDLIAAAAREGQPGWRYAPDVQELHAPNEEGRVSLQNIFLEYSNARPAVRKDLLRKYVNMIVGLGQEIPKLWTIAQKAIYPVLRARADMKLLEIESRGREKPFAPRVEIPWCEGLVVRIAYDTGPATLPIGYEELNTWGVSVDEAYDRALQNLKALPAPTWVQTNPGFFILQSQASYEETMLLREDVVASCPVRGSKVFMPINRGVLLGTGTEEPNGIEAILEEALTAFQNHPWPLSPVMVVYNGNGFESYVPSGESLVRLQALKTIDVALCYRDQQRALQEYCEREGIDVYVASADIIQEKNNPEALRTWASWTQGVPTWLPVVDLLAFNKQLGAEKFEMLIVPWNEAHAICERYMKPLAEDPPRFSVDAFPDDADWQRLRERGERLARA